MCWGKELDRNTKLAHGVEPRGFESPGVLDVLQGARCFWLPEVGRVIWRMDRVIWIARRMGVELDGS